MPRYHHVCGISCEEAKVHLVFHGGVQGRFTGQTKAIAAGVAMDLGTLVLQLL